MKKIKGIYKITSPSGKVYIGQSRNIKKRISYYSKHGCDRQPKLYSSLMKYGFKNHGFEVIHELPLDVANDIMSEYEKLYIDLYKSCGIELLNLTDGGEGQLNPSESTREKLRQASKGKRFSKEAYEKSIIVRREKGVSEETRKKRSESLKGRPSPMKGRKHTEESLIKIGNIWRDKKQSQEHIKKRSACWVGRKHSHESKKKMSVSAKKRIGDKNRENIIKIKNLQLF